jgi:tetratricopeptide (TPR) repeat protein
VRRILAKFRRDARARTGIVLLALALQGCALVVPQTDALRAARPVGLPDRVELEDVPFFPQKDQQCGPASLATALAADHVAVTPDDIAGKVFLPGREGSLQVEMLAAPRRYGMISYQLAPRFADLLREVAAGTPVIVLQDYGVKPFSLWHYAVVAGYDYPKDEMVLRSGEKRRLTMPFAVLEYTWKESDYWAMVVVPPDRIPVTATESGFLSAIAAMERVADPHATKIAYTTFLARWPDNLAAGIGLANADYALGELPNAEAILRRTAQKHPESPVVLNNLAQVVSDLGRQREALALAEQAVALGGPFAATARETRAGIRKRLGKDP